MEYTKEQLRTIAFNVAEPLAPPTWMVIRQIEIESNFSNVSVSSTGCVGICQINPPDALKPGYGITPCKNPLDPSEAVKYLCDYLVAGKRIHGSYSNALLAYNVGMNGEFTTASKAYKALASYVKACYL